MHINNITLNVLIASERFYITEINHSAMTPALIHIDSKDRTNGDIPSSIRQITEELNVLPDIVNIVISPDDYVITQFPHTEHISGEDLKKIIDFEIKQNFGDIQPDDITCLLTPLDNSLTKSDYVLTTLFKNTLKKELSESGLAKDFEIKFQFAGNTTLNSFRFNYPELSEQTSMIIGFYDNYLILSVIGRNGLAMMQYREYDNINDSIEIISNEYIGICKNLKNDNIHIYVYGEKLTLTVIEKLKEKISDTEIQRFNSFRKFSAMIDDRKKEYCSRTMHIFPPCVGASVPDFTEHIEFL